jgi:thiamine biosynthesis lipoprotein
VWPWTDDLARGHALDAVADTPRAHGVADGLLERSGSALAFGTSAGGDPWSLVIPDPRGRLPAIARLRLIPGQAAAGSGRYEPLVIADGGSYAAVVDPRTGQPAQGLIGVVALAPDATGAAAWNRALFVLGPTAARQQAKDRAELSAILIEPGRDGTDVIWVEASLKDRFVLDGKAQGLFRVATY